MLRIAVCQQWLKHYRVPVWNLLGRQDGIELTVLAAVDPSATAALDAAGRRFALVESPTRRLRRVPGGFDHQPAQLDAIDPARFDLAILPWDLHYLSTLWPALRRGRRRGVAVAMWGHGYSKREGRARLRLRNHVGRRADGVLLYSRRIAESLCREHGFDARRVFVAPNAIDQAPIQAARRRWCDRPEALPEFRERHGLDPGRTVVFLSRLIPKNRPEMLLHGLAALRARHPEARLVVIGDGPSRPDLEALAASLGLGGHVTFTGALYDQHALAPWLLSGTLLGYPVNIGLTLLHAFGFGLPAVTSDRLVAHGPEIDALEPEGNGLLYAHDDLDAMVAAWARIMDDPGRRAAMGRAALATVLETYTLPNMIQGFLDLATIVDGVQRRVRATDA